MFIVHTESSHGWGGQEIRILTESRELITRGHRVMLLADADSLIAQRAALYGVPLGHLQLKKKRLAELRAMIAALNGLRPDVISTHSSTDHWVAAVARVFAQHRPAIVRTRHVSARVARNIPTRWLYRFGCEAIATTGESIRSHLTHDRLVGADKVFSVPTGIDLKFFQSRGRSEARQRIRAHVDINPEAFVFGNIATLRSWKGQKDLITGFATIANDLPTAQLLIVGDGPQARSLRELAKILKVQDRVFFAGHQPDVRDYFDALDVFVFPSYANEGVPQAILQAMAYGLPVITTRAGSIEEAVFNYATVTIVEARASDKLAAAMREVFNQSAGAATARATLTAEVRTRIGITNMVDHMLEIYRLVCSN